MSTSSPADTERSAEGDPLVWGRSVSKRFGSTRALQHVDVRIGRGENVALWGANGAGKTTLIRCMLGVLPFSGDLAIDGMDPREHGKRVRRQVGFIPQNVAFPPTMDVGEVATFYGQFRGATDGEADRSLRAVGLIDHLEKKPQELSGGLRQRLALAVALLDQPDLLLFDEPTASLDIAAYREFVDLLRSTASPERTLIFSSHRIQEVRTLADRVLVLEEGRLVAEHEPNALEAKLGTGPEP